MSKIRCINYRSNLYNLRNRQKKLQKHQIVKVELSINDNPKSTKTQILLQFSNKSEVCCITYRSIILNLLTSRNT